MFSQTLAVVLPIAILAAALAWLYYKQVTDRRREAFLRNYRFPRGLYAKVKETYPEMTSKEYHLAAQALRQFFSAYRTSTFKFVGMPSLAADELWHNFILFTKAYDSFCRQAFGRFFHHVPVSESGQTVLNLGLQRTWVECCKQEGINPYSPSRLPLLFAIDAKLGLAGATLYTIAQPPVKKDDASYLAPSSVTETSPSPNSDNSFSVYNFIDSLVGSDSGAGDSGSGDSGSGDSGSSCGGGCGGGGD